MTDSGLTDSGGRRPKRVEHGLIAIARDIGFVSVGKYGQYIITLVTLPLIARMLGPHGVGLLAIGMSSYYIGSLAVDLNITAFLSARVHDAEGPESDLHQLRGTYLLIRATTLGTLCLALLIGLLLDAPPQLHMVLLGLVAGGVWSFSEDWLLIGQGRFAASTLYQGAGRVVYLILLVALLPHVPNASMAMLCLLLSSVVTDVLNWWDAFRTYGIPGRPRFLRQVLRLGAPIVASRALVTSYGQGSAAVYSAVLNTATLGLYSAGDRLVRAIQSMLDPIGFALLPRMARRSGEESFWRNSIRAITACVAVATVGVLCVWLAAPLLIHVMFGSAFLRAVPLLRTEVLILPATAVSSFVTTAVLPVREDTAGVFAGATVGTCVAATALLTAAHTHSVWTLVYGTVCAEFTVAGWYLIRIRWLIVRERTARRVLEPLVVTVTEDTT